MKTQTAPYWILRLGLLTLCPVYFIICGVIGVRDLFKEFWNEID